MDYQVSDRGLSQNFGSNSAWSCFIDQLWKSAISKPWQLFVFYDKNKSKNALISNANQ